MGDTTIINMIGYSDTDTRKTEEEEALQVFELMTDELMCDKENKYEYDNMSAFSFRTFVGSNISTIMHCKPDRDTERAFFKVLLYKIMRELDDQKYRARHSMIPIITDLVGMTGTWFESMLDTAILESGADLSVELIERNPFIYEIYRVRRERTFVDVKVISPSRIKPSEIANLGYGSLFLFYHDANYDVSQYEVEIIESILRLIPSQNSPATIYGIWNAGDIENFVYMYRTLLVTNFDPDTQDALLYDDYQFLAAKKNGVVLSRKMGIDLLMKTQYFTNVQFLIGE